MKPLQLPADDILKPLHSLGRDRGLSARRFSDVFGFSLDAIKHWEGGRRTPEAPARTLLTVIDKNPAAVLTALQPAVFAAAAGSSKVHTARYKTMKKTRRSGHLQELLNMEIAPIGCTH